MSDIIRYRLHTEHLSPTLVARYFDGFTILKGQGFYKGKSEDSAIVEIIGTLEDAAKVTTLAKDIREQYRQAEVWITSEAISLLRVTIDAVKDGLA